ncbi:hypothetical protein ACOSQ3_018882 [Xanthoceras sorbifolium]
MFSIKSMPSTSSVLSAYTSFTASAMLVKTVINEVQTVTTQIVPKRLQEIILSKLGGLCGNSSSQMTLAIDEFNGYSINQLYEASEIYLGAKIDASLDRVKVSKSPKEKNLSMTIEEGEKIVDIFQGVHVLWEMTCLKTEEMSKSGKFEKRVIELSFYKKDMEKDLSVETLMVDHGVQTNLHHPATFDTIAMDPSLKQALIDDLDRFVKRRSFYRKVGKAWKRGYLLYGPPGTGKSSLIAAMANYLKFNIYDLELANIFNNSELRRLLVSTANRSILVIEDIDCSLELQNRQHARYDLNERSQVTLSGLLNFIDGLWSSCGDERIIMFTTNHKDRLDPALLRPGRMDMHIHMSYCTPSGFRILVSNYLGINSHKLLVEIDELITEVKVTPAEIAEELMKSEDADIALEGLIKFVKKKTEIGNKRKATEETDIDIDENVVDSKRLSTKKRRQLKKIKKF